MNTLLKEFENMGFEVEVGYREKNRIRISIIK